MSRDAFDLFDGLARLGGRDGRWYDGLDADGKKAAAPFVIMRWLSGTSDQAQLVRLNAVVNPYVFWLGQDKGLLFRLMAAASTGKNKRYSWLKAPGGKIEKYKLEVIKDYYHISTREAQGYTIDSENLLEMAAELGWIDDDIKKLKKELA